MCGVRSWAIMCLLKLHIPFSNFSPFAESSDLRSSKLSGSYFLLMWISAIFSLFCFAFRAFSSFCLSFSLRLPPCLLTLFIEFSSSFSRTTFLFSSLYFSSVGLSSSIHCHLRCRILRGSQALFSMFLTKFLPYSALCKAFGLPLSLVQCLLRFRCRIFHSL